MAGIGWGERLAGRAQRLWQWLFPRRIELPDEARQRLAALFPTLKLERLSFHLGIPHLLQSGQAGMVLPAPLSPVRCRVYIRRRSWDPRSDDGFSLLVHEGFHALQMQELGPGLGLVRPFIILYLACSAGQGFRYHRHPMELDAYAVAGTRRSQFERAVAAGEEPGPILSSEARFWRKLAGSTPGGALLSPLWLLFWSAAAVVLWGVKLLVEGAGAAVAAGMWGLGTVIAWGERPQR